MELVVVVWVVMSPRASAHDIAAVISRPQADEDASSLFGMVTAGMGHPLGWLWVDLSQLDILGGPMSP